MHGAGNVKDEGRVLDGYSLRPGDGVDIHTPRSVRR